MSSWSREERDTTKSQAGTAGRTLTWGRHRFRAWVAGPVTEGKHAGDRGGVTGRHGRQVQALQWSGARLGETAHARGNARRRPCGFLVCELPLLLKFTCDSKISAWVLSPPSLRTARRPGCAARGNAPAGPNAPALTRLAVTRQLREAARLFEKRRGVGGQRRARLVGPR